MVTLGNERYLRSILYLSDGGSFITKAVIQRELVKNGCTLNELLKNAIHENKVKNEFKNKMQQDIIYPTIGNTCLSEWDIQMLTGIILIIFRHDLQPDERKNIRHIKLLRIQLAHSPTAALSEEEYNDFVSDLDDAMTKLVSYFGDDEEKERLQNKCKETFDRYKTCPLEVKTSVEELKKLNDTEPLITKLLDCIEKTKMNLSEAIKESETSIRSDIKEVDVKLCLVLEQLEKKLQTKPFQRESIIVNTKLTFSGDVELLVELADKVTIKVFNRAIQKTKNTEEMADIERAVDDILQKLDEMEGVKVLSAELECIIMRIQCDTFKSVYDVLQYTSSDKYKQQLNILAGAVDSYIKRVNPITVTSEIDGECLHAITSMIENDEKEESNLLSNQDEGTESLFVDDHQLNDERLQYNRESSLGSVWRESTGWDLKTMDGKLNLKHKTSIIRFIDSGAKDFHLLYSFTRDGANATTFHQKCDNKGPTVTVVYNTKDSIFGGYVEKSWTSDSTGAYVKDDKAFLFRLVSNGNVALNKFPVKASDQAFYCIDTHGPVFGSGHDLDVFSDTLTAQGNQFSLNGVMKMGTTYDMGGVAVDKVTDNVNTVFDVEVYSLSESPLVSVWRTSTGWESKDLMLLKRYAESYTPPHGLDIETANILVIGPVGAGKSSFFNTVASVFRGHISDQAVCGSAEKSITSKYRMYRVRSSLKQKPLKFCLCDTMGLEESHGIDAQELGYLLDGHVTDGYQFNPTTPISNEINGFVKFPTLRQKIHCVCFVFDGSTVTILSDKMLEKVKSMQAKVRQKGLPQAIVLTKIDNVCSYVKKDITKVYQIETIKNLVDKVSNIFGVPRSFILPLKNYEKEIDVDTHVSILAMHTLKRLLLSTESYLFNFLDTLDVNQQEVEGRHGN